MKTEKKYNFKLFLVGLFLVAFFQIFYYMKIVSLEGWDIGAHTEFAKLLFTGTTSEESSFPKQAISYPLYHIMQKFVAVILNSNYEASAMLILVGANIVTIFLVRFLLNKIVKPMNLKQKLLIDGIALSCIYVNTIKSILTGGRYYARQMSANPVHNPTLIFCRPFGIISFYCFVIALEKIKKSEKCTRELILFGVSTFLGCLSKPSFDFVLLPAMGLVVFIYMIKEKDIFSGIKMFICVFPTLILLVYQYIITFEEQSAFSLEIHFGGFADLSLIEVLTASIATFPVPIIVYFRNDIKKGLYGKVAYLTLLFGWMQMFFLTDGPSGDFGWGYMLSVFLATVVCMGGEIKKAKYDIFSMIVFVIYFVQVIVGIRYVYMTYQLGYYYF